ncbi:MAG: hypothetical protein HQL66_09335 [Magnetococcales bacterium]|nr:hypothetical protein [Magnetococcales bacterium]
MTCGIDEILQKTQTTLDDALHDLVQSLAADYNLEVDPTAILAAPQAKELHGALQTFAVWMIHSRRP